MFSLLQIAMTRSRRFTFSPFDGFRDLNAASTISGPGSLVFERGEEEVEEGGKEGGREREFELVYIGQWGWGIIRMYNLLIVAYSDGRGAIEFPSSFQST